MEMEVNHTLVQCIHVHSFNTSIKSVHLLLW